MSLLGNLSTAAFIRQYWQQQPLVVRGALPDVTHLIDGDELAGIACEAEAEARIVIEHDDNWTCEHGPFAESHFAKLPPVGWTLLVQSVDHWVPAVAVLLDHFDFLPRWRLDDIMISVAAVGGGVGPHFDYYDVFLIQAAGTRQWRIGQHCDERTPLRDHPDLRLLPDFEVQEEHRLDAGDLLYLPAGRAHWGTASSDDCITISIGFRAPSHRDLLLGAADRLADELADDQRYRDSVASIDADPHRINAAAIEQMLAAWPGAAGPEVRAALAHALGTQSTEPRYPEHVEADTQWTAQKLDKWLARNESLAIERHSASRFAWYADENDESHSAQLYVDGQAHTTTPDFARELCGGHVSAKSVNDQRERMLLLGLLNAGSVRADT